MNRNLEPGFNFTKGLVFAEFSFATNNTSTPLSNSIRGAIDLLDQTTPLNRTAVGIIRVKFRTDLQNKVRYLVTKYVDLDDAVSGSDDGGYATSGPDVNDPGVTLAPNPGGTNVQFDVFTRAAAGTKTDFTGRRVCVGVCMKNSTVGV